MREMKDSGVAWLGDIDSRFDIKAIGNLFTIKKDIIGREPDQVLSITQRGIKIKDTTSNEGQNAASYAHYQIVNVGDFAMNHMDLLTGWVDISRYEGVTSPDYRVFTLTDNTQIPEYFLRVFQMYYSNRVFYAFGQGAANLGRWRLPRENFVKIAIPRPPVELQRKIVDEIAAKVSKVDALIANQQAQIEKLKQYKQSLITEVVTKGLELNAPMKDSGIEWIGEINAGFRLMRLKHVALILDEYRKPITADQRNQDADVLYDYYGAYGVIDKIDGYTIDDHVMLIGEDGANLQMRNLPLMYEVNGKAWINNHAHILKPKADVDFYYLFYALEGLDINPYITGSAQPKLNQENLKNLWIPIPDLETQASIVRYIRDKHAKIDELIRIKTKKLSKLDEYKKAIVYEYVTGKKEVGLHE